MKTLLQVHHNYSLIYIFLSEDTIAGSSVHNTRNVTYRMLAEKLLMYRSIFGFFFCQRVDQHLGQVLYPVLPADQELLNGINFV